MARFNQVTIVGLGLIGGSLGMALRRRRLARRVVGLSRTASTARRAKARGAVDLGTTDPARAVRDADLVVLAGPVDSVVPQARRLARLMRPGAVLTDVGSTKRRIVAGLEGALLRRVAFIGAHPLAGSEQRGIAAARAELFDGAVCIVTATPKTDRRALRQVVRLWKPLVRRVVVMDPARHDRWLAAVSHLPHLIAFCLMESLEDGARAIAPRSFLDATRVAKSDPDLWDDILLTNREAVLAAMSRFERRWTAARRLLQRRNPRALQRFLRHAQALRRQLQDR
ncbi:MAG: prephenate dehydrogenase/arogenate dehydrogenase family protein [Candidatus Omnitrophica bacterium]|nr:prephenate dehydrogenase/arogenate dehydrogenase family protein [Candidatus Omnitrophota bacterium]